VAGLQSVKTGDMIETGKYKEYRNMERLKRISAATALLVLSLGITVTIPVYAEGSSNSGSDSSVSDQSSSGSTLEDRQKLAEDRQAVKTAATTVKEDRQQLKTDRTEKTAEQKQKLCTAHKQGLENKFNRIVTNSQKIKTKIDGVLTKAQDYQSKNNLTVENWDSLLAAAQTAQTAAGDSITNLQSVKPSLDCNSTSVSTDVANFKTAAKDTRDKLKAYRDAVRSLLHAEATAKHAASDKSTSEGSN
jgi:chromosome segregation ATPase